MRCNCPYIVCPLHGDCVACIEHNRLTGDMAHCMEATAIARGAVMPFKLPKKVYLEDSFEAMSQQSADLIIKALKEKPESLICLPAGNTAIRTYEILAEYQARGEVDFSKTSFVALDEWLDLEDESENCDAFMRKHFYGPLGIPDEQVKRFDIHATDLDQVCKEVDQYIFDRGGIDILLLGMGMNGHLGLNEPGGDFSEYAKVVDLDTVTMSVGQKYFSHEANLSRGITLGIHHVFDARLVILQVGGAHKAEITEKLIRTAPTEMLPATVLKLIRNGVLVLDRDAATKVLDLL